MLKVLLIDDEQNILTGLCYIIDWNAQGFEICGTFQNPKEALNCASVLHPDLIITDIEMPGTSGLDLIAALRETLPKSLFVILSAYEDFGYAQRAVELGVFRYLLKPLSAENLTSLLIDVQKHFSATHPATTELSIFRNFVIREVVLSGLELCHAATIPFYKDLLSQTHLQLALVSFMVAGSKPIADIDATMKLQALFHPHSVFVAGDCFVLLLDASQTVTAEYLNTTLDCPCAVEISSAFVGLPDAHSHYDQLARIMQDNLFWEGREKTNNNTIVPELPDEETTTDLRRAIWYCDETALDNAFERLWTQLQVSRDSLTKNDVIRIYDKLFKIAETLSQNISAYNRVHQAVSIRLSDCRTLSQMHNYALREFHTFMTDMRNLASDNSPNLIRRAKAHILEHYAEPEFRLTDIADALYVNYSYLSNLFKQETGDTLSNYLLEQRMKRAKELLTDPRLSVTDISLQVGYHNAKTFYSTFKKYYNESPRSYQQRHLRRKV